jgi:hypothetical protein
MKRWWIKFLCRTFNHRMRLIGENVGWHHWQKWHQCKRCGHTEETVEFKF